MLKDKLKFVFNYPIINKMWQLLKTVYKYTHKGITATKALLYFTGWFVTQRTKVYKKFSAMGIRNITTFKPFRWKNGTMYFLGKIYGQDVFIKTGGIIDTTDREKYALDYIASNSTYLASHIPKLIKTDDFVVEEMIYGESLIKYENSIVQDHVVSELYRIYEELKRLRVMHLDIRPENFIVKKDGTVILIDFGFALVNTTDIYDRIICNNDSKRIIKNLGSKYSAKNGILDDAYSMVLTMKYVCPSLLNKHPDMWKSINLDIGTRIVEVE